MLKLSESFIECMECLPVAKLPEGPQWSYEIKLDRFRLQAVKAGKQVTVYFSAKKDGPRETILIYLPADAKGPVPVFLGVNFTGNHRVSADRAIELPSVGGP